MGRDNLVFCQYSNQNGVLCVWEQHHQYVEESVLLFSSTCY